MTTLLSEKAWIDRAIFYYANHGGMTFEEARDEALTLYENLPSDEPQPDPEETVAADIHRRFTPNPKSED